MGIRTFFRLVILFILLSSCISNEEKKTSIKQNTPSTPINNPIEKPFIIKLERGAFHYDTFTLTDSILEYNPENNLKADTTNPYSFASRRTITNEQKLNLIELINANNFWSLENKYKAKSSCTSGIVIEVTLENQHKKITSDDYKRDCPEILLLLEKKLIKLQGGNLKRIYLVSGRK